MNILDYIKWRGDLTFDKSPFNYVDNIILCELVYLRFNEFIDDKAHTIRELYDLFLNHFGEDAFINDNSWHKNDLLKEMAFSDRFKNIIFYNYSYLKDFESSEQFCAVMYDLPDGTTYIAYKGTDASMIGWKENFISTYSKTSGQIDAVRYLENNYNGLRRFRIGGHSKGAYLATYAALKANKDIQDNIIEIISNDGPGLNGKIIDIDDFDSLKDRYIKIIPEDDVIGMAFDNGYKTLIIKSSKNGLFSHNSFTWLVERDHFIEGELTEKALNIKDSFEQFIINTTPQERERLTNAIFDIAEKNNIKKYTEIDPNNLLAYLKAIKQLAELDNDNKEVANKFLKVFTNYYEDKISQLINKLDFRKKNEEQQ